MLTVGQMKEILSKYDDNVVLAIDGNCKGYKGYAFNIWSHWLGKARKVPRQGNDPPMYDMLADNQLFDTDILVLYP